VFNSVSNFILPPLLYVIAMRTREKKRYESMQFSSAVWINAARVRGNSAIIESKQGNLQSLVADVAGGEGADAGVQTPTAISSEQSPVLGSPRDADDANGPPSPGLRAISPLMSASELLMYDNAHKTNHVFNWPRRLYPYRMRIAQLLVLAMIALCLLTLVLNFMEISS
jgi:hypothetical protein